MPDQKQKNQSAEAVAPVYEVMTDVWGYDGPDEHKQFVRGDLVREGDAPYDFGWAEQLGALRRVEDNVLESGSESTTRPLNPDGSVDQQAQTTARVGAGLPPEKPADKPAASAPNPADGKPAATAQSPVESKPAAAATNQG